MTDVKRASISWSFAGVIKSESYSSVAYAAA